MNHNLLAVTGLSVFSTAERKTLVDGVSFSIRQGEAFSLIGESGSGKSLIAQVVTGSLPAELSTTGSVIFDNMNLVGLAEKERRKLWGRKLFLVPQESQIALDPTMRILKQVVEIFTYYKRLKRRDALAQAGSTMEMFGLSSLRDGNRFPCQLSGGMNQRAAMAISLAVPAEFIVVDEPTNGLDPEAKNKTVQLLKKLVDQGKTLLCITHDLDVARELGGRIAVMYGGYIIETGLARQVLDTPSHPYTRGLINAAPENGLQPIPDQVLATLKTAWGLDDYKRNRT